MTARTMWALMFAVMTMGVLATSTPARADGFSFSIVLGDRDGRHPDDGLALQLGWFDDDRDDAHRYWGDFEPCDRCRDRARDRWCTECRNRWENRRYGDLCDRCREPDHGRWCDSCRDRYDRYDRDRYGDRDWETGRRVTLPPGVYGGPYGLYAETRRGTVPLMVEPDRHGYTTTIYGERRSPFVGRPNWAHEQWQTNDRAPAPPVTIPAPIANSGRRAHPIGPPITR